MVAGAHEKKKEHEVGACNSHVCLRVWLKICVPAHGQWLTIFGQTKPHPHKNYSCLIPAG